MSKKIFMLLFLMLVLISMSAVSAVDADNNNDLIVSSENAGAFTVANDIGTIDNSNGDVADGNDEVLEKDAKSIAVGENNEIYGGAYENSSSQLLASSDDNNVLEYENGSGILKETSATWYVDVYAASGGDGKSEATAFQTLKSALNAAGNNDIIKISSGTYIGSNNVGLSITKNLTFEKYGYGEAVFDAQSNNRIWSVNAETINIQGLTFKNGKYIEAGAILFSKALSNSIINATFINNTVNDDYNGGAIIFEKKLNNVSIYGEFIGNKAKYGGAIRFMYECNSVIIDAAFVNNTASYYGGALSFYDSLNNVNISGIFMGNKARFGGAINGKSTKNSIINATFINNAASDVDGFMIDFSGNVDGVDISGKFINNKAVSVIRIATSSNNVIHDSIFINNKAIRINNGNIQAINNWFGNNATNYNETPNAGISLDNWLFLNATSDSSEVEVFNYSKIVFNLFSYNNTSKNTTDYDASKMNVELNLNQTLGELDKTAASLGEEITYTARYYGEASVTGTFETVSYTVNLKNNGIPIELDLHIISPLYYNPSISGEIEGTVKNKMTGDKVYQGFVDLYLNEVFVQTVYVDGNNGSVYLNLGVLDAGNYSVEAFYHDDSKVYMDSEMNRSFEIKKFLTVITVINVTDELIVGNSGNVVAVLTPSEAGNLSYSSNDTSVVIVDERGNLSAVGVGTAAIIISFEGNKNYAAESEAINVTVIANDASVSVDNSTLDLKVGDTYAINATAVPAILNITYTSSDESVVVVDENGTVTAVGKGNAIITVAVGDGKIFAKNSTQISVTVTPLVFKISENKNVVAVYSSKATYKVFVTREGKAVGAGEKVTFNYNGKTYTVNTDKNGYATLNLNTQVKVKKYTITATYKGVKVTNKVTINHVIKAGNKKVKKSKKVTKVKVSLKKVNGKYLKGKVLKIKFNKKTYKVKTNKKGTVTWKVKKSMLKKLKVGKKYQYKVTYGKDIVTKKLTIKK